MAFSTIEQPTSTIEFAVANTAVAESTDSISVDLQLQISTDGILGSAVQGDVVIMPTGTAAIGADVTPLGIVPVVFPAGSTDGATAGLTISLRDDLEQDGHKTVDLELHLSGAQVGLGTIATHTVTIIDNETIPLPGDFNGDNSVNAADYTMWRDSLGTANPAADGDLNGVVDRVDYGLWKTSFGNSIVTSGAAALQLSATQTESAEPVSSVSPDAVDAVIAPLGELAAIRGRSPLTRRLSATGVQRAAFIRPPVDSDLLLSILLDDRRDSGRNVGVTERLAIDRDAEDNDDLEDGISAVAAVLDEFEGLNM